MSRILIALGFSILIGSATLAETTVPPEFVACSRIQKNAERLACYDRAVAYLGQPAGQQTAAPSPETSFGLQASVPQPPAAARETTKDDEVTSITARVTKVSADREGKKVLELDNGQTWRELNKSGYLSIEIGDEITITRAALGSFMMSAPNSRPFRVRRVR